jgi:DNA-binding IclR family transcriptional regulator
MEESASSLVAKVATVLRAVADYGHTGARLIDIARESGIARPTVHRILQDLAREQLIAQQPDRRYRLGPTAFSLSLSAPFPLNNPDAIEGITQDLADYTTFTCYLGALLRRRVFYITRAQGSSPIHIYSVNVGETRPLTTTHAGVALLATLEEAERETFLSATALERTRRQYEIPLALDAEAIRDKVSEVREKGFLYAQNLTSPGVAGMAAPVPVRSGKPFLAITISAVNEHLTSSAAAEFAPRLLRATEQIAQVLEE